MIVLVDTNVLLSAALRDRLPERVVWFVATRDEWKWVVTDDIITEYVEVLRRPKFGISTEVLLQWQELLALRTVNAGDPPVTPEFPRDPKDAAFLAAALFTQADFLVTGDNDMLSVAGTIATRIVSVSEFAATFQIQ